MGISSRFVDGTLLRVVLSYQENEKTLNRPRNCGACSRLPLVLEDEDEEQNDE